jgi:hypothetical protein
LLRDRKGISPRLADKKLMAEGMNGTQGGRAFA